MKGLNEKHGDKDKIRKFKLKSEQPNIRAIDFLVFEILIDTLADSIHRKEVGF